jgi:hypothetical protein
LLDNMPEGEKKERKKERNELVELGEGEAFG